MDVRCNRNESINCDSRATLPSSKLNKSAANQQQISNLHKSAISRHSVITLRLERSAEYEEECFSNVAQDFLICTTVHKARQLGVFQGEIYVRLIFDTMTRQTKTFSNSENPYFNEYFVFEMKCTLSELLRLTIVYKVKKRMTMKRDLVLGELLVDMQSVWNQRNRCYFKRWGRLERDIEEPAVGTGSEANGFLQIDLAIVSQATNTNALFKPDEGDLMSMNVWQMHQDYDDIEKNLLENSYFDVRCNIRYTITFYRAVMIKKLDYMLQFRFHPFKGKTRVAKSTQYPAWNQAITFAWTYPSLSQTIVIQLMAHEHMQWKCLVEYEIHLDEISFKDKPSLGPCFIHLYDSLNPTKYVGRLLLEIRSECLEGNPQRTLHISNVTRVDEKRYWDEDMFILEFTALEGDFVHGNLSNCKIHMKLGEHISNHLECFLKPYPIQTGQQTAVNILKYFRKEPPFKAISLRAQLPDNRRKYEIDIFAKWILNFVQQELEVFKQFQIQYGTQRQAHIKVLREILSSAINTLKSAFERSTFEYRGLKEPTQYDVKRFHEIKEQFVNFLDDLKLLRSNLRASNDTVSMDRLIEETAEDVMRFIVKLQHFLALSRQGQDEWPELLLQLSGGNKQIGVCRLSVKDFVQMPQAEQGEQCWKVRNFTFKEPQCQHSCNKCGCIAASVLGCLSIVAEKERNDFFKNLKVIWSNPEPFYWTPKIRCTYFKCRLFIHQAKVRPGNDINGLCDPYVKVMIGANGSETPLIFGTLSPIWNCVISFDHIRFPGNLQWYRDNPPLAAVELLDMDKFTADDYLGSALVKMSVIKKEWLYANNADETKDRSTIVKNRHALQKFHSMKYLSPPPLKWIPIALAGTIRAEILMSGELVETDEPKDEMVVEKPKVTTGIPAVIRPNMRNYVLEVVFAGLRSYKKSSLLSYGRHRIKIMMGDLVLTSGLSTSRIRNSINFLILYATSVVSLPEQLEYWPAIIATDVLVSAKGKETTVGAALITNTKRYLQEYNYLPCIEMDSGQESEPESCIETSETSPLLKKNSRDSFWHWVFGNSKNNKKRTETADLFDFTDLIDENEYSWWTKFYNSSKAEPCSALSRFKHKLCIYNSELEKQLEFSHFTDWAEPLQMIHGINHRKGSVPIEHVYCTLKLNMKITPCQCPRSETRDAAHLRPLGSSLNSRFQAKLQSLSDLVNIIVRVYIVQGLQFRPIAKHAQAHSYVRLQLGSKHVSNRAEYIANVSNPIFGKCFELEALLPREHILEVSVFNRCNLIDEAIGSTHIDLEDRWRSKHRATVGIANEYSSFGYNKWRDYRTPLDILNDLCAEKSLKPPKFTETTIEVDGVTFTDETQIAVAEDIQDRLSLTALKNFEQLPSFGYKLLPEHVETRSVYRPDYPGIEQGKIQLWLELYDGNMNLPPAIDITPQPVHSYELRVIVIGVSDVILEERNIFGTAMSDIYVKGWCADPDDAQSTDIHYRSLNGEGKFNWRMIFPLKYSNVEDMMVVKRRTGILEEIFIKQPPILSLQIWDNDLLSKDDFLGSLEIELSHFVPPTESAKKCQLIDCESRLKSMYMLQGKSSKGHFAPAPLKLLNLFRQKNVKGWFPLKGIIPDKGYELGLTGKIELELELVPEQEALTYPVGLARAPPNALPMPVRPDTSFNPLTHPWRGFKQIILPKLVKYLLVIGLLVLFGFSIYMSVITLPLGGLMPNNNNNFMLMLIPLCLLIICICMFFKKRK